MEEQDRFSLGIRGIMQGEKIARGAQAAENRGARRGGNGQAVEGDRDFPVTAPPSDSSLLAPDTRPPRAGLQSASIIGRTLDDLLKRIKVFALHFAGNFHGTCWRRKKPLPFVMKRYCELNTSVGANNPPFQFIHAPPLAGLN